MFVPALEAETSAGQWDASDAPPPAVRIRDSQNRMARLHWHAPESGPGDPPARGAGSREPGKSYRNMYHAGTI